MQLTDEFTDDDIRLLESLKRFKKRANGMPPPTIERRNEMTDQELLEAAAKAATLDVFWAAPGIYYLVDPGRDKAVSDKALWRICRTWNPLNDDGDAFRLMNRLQISIDARIVSVAASRYDAIAGTTFTINQRYIGESDDGTALRRAIVMVAAINGANDVW